MTLSPSDRAAVLEMAAEKLAATIRSECDLLDCVTFPVSVVSQFTGLSRSQVERTFPIRQMGKRKAGVSLKDYQAYMATKP